MFKIKTGKLYGEYVHPWGIEYTEKNIKIRKRTLSALPIFKKLRNRNFKRIKVLEIGGTGQDAVAWSELGFDVTYIDLSKDNIIKTKKYARKKKLTLKTINKNFHKIKFESGKFDIVRSRGVIHHMLAPTQVFKKIYNILKNEGYFHFNLYRSGTFYYFFIESLRKISKFINVKKFYKELMKFKLTKKEDLDFGNPTIRSKSKFYDIILDDLFVPTLNPANYYEIKKDLKNFGFKIVRENKIKKRLDHNLLYPDYPLKKEHIVFDVIKKQRTKKKSKFLYKVSNIENKIIKNIKIYNLSNKAIMKLTKIVINKKIYNNKLFLFYFINLYKSCHLLSVSNLTGVQKHIALQKNVESIIEKFQN